MLNNVERKKSSKDTQMTNEEIECNREKLILMTKTNG